MGRSQSTKFPDMPLKVIAKLTKIIKNAPRSVATTSTTVANRQLILLRNKFPNTILWVAVHAYYTTDKTEKAHKYHESLLEAKPLHMPLLSRENNRPRRRNPIKNG